MHLGVVLCGSISHKILTTPTACQTSFENFSLVGYKNSSKLLTLQHEME